MRDDDRAKLPEPSIRPPPFLSPFEAMRDIYVRTRARFSPKIKDLLMSPELEDMVNMLVALHAEPKLVRHADASLSRQVKTAVGPTWGPIVSGFSDPRLAEPWRLFLDDWDIWSIEDGKPGVELFLEGEMEMDDDETVSVLQSLGIQGSELVLEAVIGSARDRITFDGKAFYRLKH